jgi:hypothetical protein
MRSLRTFWTTSVLIAAVSFNAHAASSITCNEYGEFDNETIGTVTVELNDKGLAQKVIVKRQATDELEAMDVSFDVANDKIVHEIRDGVEEGINEDTGKKMFAWGIEKIEHVEAQNSKGQKVSLSFKDFLYAGIPGSRSVYELNGSSFDTRDFGPVFSCEGNFLLKSDLK